MKSAVVAWALDTGAAIANDIWGLEQYIFMSTSASTEYVLLSRNRR